MPLDQLLFEITKEGGSTHAENIGYCGGMYPRIISQDVIGIPQDAHGVDVGPSIAFQIGHCLIGAAAEVQICRNLREGIGGERAVVAQKTVIGTLL